MAEMGIGLRRCDGVWPSQAGRSNVKQRIGKLAAFAVFLGVVGFALAAAADEEPKRGGSLTFIRPAATPPGIDSPPEASQPPAFLPPPPYTSLLPGNPDQPRLAH